MRNKIFTVLLAGLFFIGIFCFVRVQNEDSALERKTLATNSKLEEKNLLNNSFQSTFEDVLTDQIPFKNEMITTYFKTKIYLYTPFDNGPVKLNDDVIKIDDYYVKNLPQYDASKLDIAKKRAYNIRYFAEAYEWINFYVYKPTRIEETSLMDSDNIKSYGPYYTEAFKNELGPLVTYKEMEINSLEEYQELFYKTDIHWNIYGAYQGYSDIITMIQEKHPDIADPKEIVDKVCFDNTFYGATANKIAQQTEPECICDLELADIGEYDYYKNGQLTEETYKENYINGNYDTKYSDYDNYYGSNDYVRVYEFDNNTGVNVLLFVDSYSNPNKEWIASHFDTVVYVDMRACPYPENFWIWNDFLDKYQITDVVVTQYYDNLFFNGNNFIPYNGV